MTSPSTAITPTAVEPANILLVDDQEKNLVALKAVLDEPGLNLVTALSGYEALDKMLEHDFALIILDVQMPGMDGIETARLIHGTKRTMHIPIIFVTAISKEPEYVVQGYEAGAVDYLFKPLKPEILKSKAGVFIELFRKSRELQRSISELESAREQLSTQAEELQVSNKSLEQFTYSVSHDLKEPLRTVSSFLEVLDEEYSEQLDEHGRGLIHFAVDGSRRMSTIIDNLLNYSLVNRKTPEVEAVDCNLVLKEVLIDLHAAIHESEAQITTDDLLPVSADPAQVKQLLQNLLSNAIKFHDGQPPNIRITSTQREDGLIQLAVMDEGIGIAEHNQEKIFDIFQRLDAAHHTEGNGIGLAICKSIVKKHGGEIWLNSQPGKGSHFYFTFNPVEEP